jgi:hypothetical protein
MTTSIQAEQKLVLRYVVETKFSATFTASKNLKTEDDVIRLLMSLGLLNFKAGYKKYSNPILYDQDNKIIRRYIL